MDADYINETLELLEDLTEEELQELNDIFDPENNLLPIHERMSYQCSKQPSRQFNKDQLNKHLENAAVESTVGKDYVPFVKKEKDYSNHTLNVPPLRPVARARTPSPLPDLTKEELECFENATEDELVEVAAMLKMNELVTAEQVEQVEHGRKPSASGILRPTLVKTQYPVQKSFSIDEDDDIEETVDVDAMVKALRSKGEDISIIVCNNQPFMDPEVLEEIAAHLLANKNIRHLSLANCNVTDSVIDSFAEALENNTKLETLNLESNFITPVGIKKLMDAIEESKTLREIRLENQYSKIGPKCEAQMADCVSKNFILLNFGYSFETRGPRDAMNRYILRNNDLLRKNRKQGAAFYNLAEQKRIIAKFKPPWIMRRPKRKGPDAEMFEGRKIIMKGSSKKKKKKGGALMSEMLSKASEVSKRWETKEKTGELHSEYARIEEQSKVNMEEALRRKKEEEMKQVAEHGDRRRGRRRNRDNEEENEELVNGEAESRKGQRDVNGEVQGMGAASRRRGRGGRNEDDDEDDEGGRKKKGDEDDDDADDGGSGRRKMDKETRMKAMKGGRVVDDEQVGMSNMSMRNRRKKPDYDEDEDNIDNNNNKTEEIADNDATDSPAKTNNTSTSSNRQKIPQAKTIGSQPIGGLDSLSIRNRRKKVVHDEEEDLDALLNSVNADADASNATPVDKEKASPKPEESSIRRRKKNQQDEEESLDDLLSSVKKVDKAETKNEDEEEREEEANENGKVNKVKVPSGKTIGSQPVAQLESLSLRGRRKKVTYDEEESVDDLLKSVKTADAKEQPKEEETQEEDDDGKDDDGVKESATKLPTGRKVGSQKVAELESLSIRDRRKKKAYNDVDEDDIDALLSSVSKDEKQVEKTKEDKVAEKGPRIPAGKKLTQQPVGELGSLSFRERRKQKLEEEEEQQKSEKEAEEDGGSSESSASKTGVANKSAEPRVPSGKAIAKDKVVGLETLSFAERRRRKRLGLDVPEDDAPVSVAPVEENEKDTKDAAEDKAVPAKEKDEKVGVTENKPVALRNGDASEKVEDNASRDVARDRRRRRLKDDDDNEEEAEKKRESRRSSRKASNEEPKEPEKPNEEPKPVAKPEPVAIKAPERPAIDFSKPMTLRERRRLKEQGLL